MTEGPAKDALLALIQSAVATAVARGRPLEDLRGVALYDSARDRFLTDLDAFRLAASELVGVSHFAERMGASAAERICLQLAYEYFARIKEVVFDQLTFDQVWADLVAEIDEPTWVWRGVANMRSFGGHLARLTAVGGDTRSIPLGDGIFIRARHFEELARLGFSEHVLSQIEADWHDGHGASSFVLTVDQDGLKTPENLIATDTTLWVKAMRAVGAMRLVGDGDVSIGPMWITRPARFNAGIGGTSRVGMSVPSWGHPYDWAEDRETRFPAVYAALARLERHGYSRGPGNLGIALRYFMATYDRWPAGNDSKLLDAVTSLEGVLGAESEISFKLAFRVASILAASDDERSQLLRFVKAFYDVRSRLVHGGSLSAKKAELLARVDELRAIVRRLLCAFVLLAVDEASPFDRQFFSAELDIALISGTRRDELRRAMGFA